MKVVIGIGGSILASPIDVEYIKRFANFLIKLHKRGYKLMVVVGGGKAARDYIAGAQKLGATDELCDEIGIALTRVNAMLLQSALREYAIKRIPTEVKKTRDFEGILVMGGTKPGQTTDAVAAHLAWLSEADLLLIASNVAGVYDSDPKVNQEATLYPRLSTAELLDLASKKEHTPGYTGIIDPVAAELIHKKKIKTVVVDGRDLGNMEKAIKGASYTGTLIS